MERGIGRKSEFLDPTKNYEKIKSYLETLKKNKKLDKVENVIKEEGEEEENKSESPDYYDEEKYLEEGESPQERVDIRKRKTRKKAKRDKNKIEFRDLFDEQNINKEEQEEIEKKVESEIKVKVKEQTWEDRFKMFKLYINKLKGMNQKEFKIDLFKFLKEEEKFDFKQMEQMNQVDRINKYKAFINKSKINKLIYNKFHSSRIIFTPGCIFNTLGLFPE